MACNLGSVVQWSVDIHAPPCRLPDLPTSRPVPQSLQPGPPGQSFQAGPSRPASADRDRGVATHDTRRSHTSHTSAERSIRWFGVDMRTQMFLRSPYSAIRSGVRP